MSRFTVRSSGSVEGIYHRVQLAHRILQDAAIAASDVGADQWEFAVEISEFKRLGVTPTDLRWMVHKGLIEHGEEVHSKNRLISYPVGMVFSESSCFVLTSAGQKWVPEQEDASYQLPVVDCQNENQDASDVGESMATYRTELAPAKRNGRHSRNVRQEVVKPRWDADTRRLCLGDSLVKQFKCPAENQERIIVAFDEEGWPPRIDDPLPPVAEVNPKKRLHDTINAFNRNQIEPLIRLKGDGTGEGILWEPS